mgnify:FL=1
MDNMKTEWKVGDLVVDRKDGDIGVIIEMITIKAAIIHWPCGHQSAVILGSHVRRFKYEGG